MFFFLTLLLVFPAWMRGGTRLELMGPAPWIALAALLAMLLRPDPREGETVRIARLRIIHRLLSDPILYIGVAFLFLLTLQWWNGPRVPEFDVKAWAWTYAPPPRPNLPMFCVNRDEALEMLFWFIPLYVALVVIRNGFSRGQKLDLLRVLAGNAAVLAILGFAQYLSGTHKIYWTTPLSVHFFSSFGYQNHAAAFFILGVIVCLGLLLRSLLHRQQREELPWLLPAIGLCAAAALFSRSRAAIVVIGLVAVAGIAYGFKRIRRDPTHGRWASTGRAGILAILVAFLGVVIYAAWVVPGSPVREEIEGTTMEHVVSRMEVKGDPFKHAAIQIWRDHSWFGVGGWGFRQFLPLYFPMANSKTSFFPGAANVHNDPLQFLVEFGSVGAGLLLATLLFLLVPVFRALRHVGKAEFADPRPWILRVPPLGLCLLAGLLVTLIHSFADLPFRSPAILWMWFAILACAPDFCERRSSLRNPAVSAGAEDTV